MEKPNTSRDFQNVEKTIWNPPFQQANEPPNRPTPPFAAASLQALLDAVSRSSLDPRRKGEVMSSLRTVARLIGRSPPDIPLDLRALSKRLDRGGAAPGGLSAGRLANIRSHLRLALSLVRPELMVRLDRPLLPEWQALADQLQKYQRVALSKLLRWLSAANITPETMGDEHLLTYRRLLFEEALLDDPGKSWQALSTKWNAAVLSVPGWPALTIARPPHWNAFTLPWSQFPASLEAGVRFWLDRLAGGDPFDPTPFQPVKSSTLEFRERQFRTLASAMVRGGVPSEKLTGLDAMVELRNLKAGLHYLHKRNGEKKSSYLHGMVTLMLAVARHNLHLPEREIRELQNLAARLAVPQTGMTEKNRERLRPLSEEPCRQALLNLPQTLLSEAKRCRRPARAHYLHQSAVIIEILLMRPLRLENLRELELDRHVLIDRKGQVHIRINPEETKNKADYDYSLPMSASQMLGTYLREHRQAIAGNKALIPGRCGTGFKSRTALRTQIETIVRTFSGLTVHPHLFRHIVAYLILTEEPGNYGVASQVLGHKSIKTTQNAYAGMETRAAVSHYERILEDLRSKAPRKPLRDARRRSSGATGGKKP